MQPMRSWVGWSLVLILVSTECRTISGAEAAGNASLAAPPQPGRQVARPDERDLKLDRTFALMQACLDQTQRRRSPADDVFLANALCALHVAAREVNLLSLAVNEAEVLASLAERPWQHPASEPWQAYLTRLVQQAEQAGDEINRRLAESKPLYTETIKQAWPFDWQSRHGIWLELLELMLATRSGEDVTTRWRTAAEAHAAEADLFRKAYVVSARVSAKPGFDWEFVRPAVVKWSSTRDRHRLRWCVEVLHVLLAAGGDPPSPGRKESAALLGQILRDEGEGLQYLPRGDLQALGTLYQLADQRAQPEAAAILSAILGTKTGFRMFAMAAGIPPERQRTLALAAPLRLPDQGTLEERLHAILDRSTLRVWIDDAVLASKANPDLGAVEGPRLEVLEQLLARTKLHLEILESNLFWIGPPDRLAAARQLHAGSLQRAAAAQGKSAVALRDDTGLEFIRTPLRDVVCFLRDQHDLPFEDVDQSDRPITLNYRAVPLHLALTLLARQIDGDWCAAGDTLFVGSQERLVQVRQLELNRLRRWSRLGLADNAVTRALRADTRLEFSETPLTDVAAFLATQHKVRITATPAAADRRITQNSRGLTLDEALDILCLRHALRWETDGQSIQIAAEAKVPAPSAAPPSPRK